MQQRPEALLNIADFSDPAAAEQWLEKRLSLLAAMTGDALVTCPVSSVTAPEVPRSPLGICATAAWHQFAMAVFMADWACYPKPVDRADFVRLLSVLSLFPAGFRVWICTLPDGSAVPVGYTGWYPISETVFDLLYNQPASITHRGVMVPLRELTSNACVYLFNYSIAPQLRKTDHSARLVKDLADDIARSGAAALAAVTVSEDGERVARRFGLSYRGDMIFEDEREAVYAARIAQTSSQANASVARIEI